MQLPRFTIPLSLALWNLISIEAYPVSTSAYPSASTTFAGPRVTVSPASISNRGQPVTENEGMIAERGDEGTTFHEKQRRPPADTEPCSKIMGDDRQPDKDSVIDVKSTIAFSQMNAGTTLEARDSTTIALFSVPDPNWSRSLISEIATEPTSTLSTAARDGTVKMSYLSSTRRDDDIRYGTTLTLTPSPSSSNPTMTTAIAADSSSRPTGESTSAGGASAPGLLDAVPPLHPLLQWVQFAMTFVGGNISIHWVLSYKRPNPDPRDDVKLGGGASKKRTCVLKGLTLC